MIRFYKKFLLIIFLGLFFMLDRELSGLIKDFFSKNLKREIVPGKDYIPATGKVFDERELQNAIEAVLDGCWTHDRFALKFESEFCSFLGSKNALLCNSGSSANLLAFSSLLSPGLKERAIKKGSEVITIAANFPTTVNPIIINNCIPVFVDVSLQTYNALPALVADAVTEKTAAIFLPHTLGNPFDLDKICKIAKEHGLWLISDNCDALGAKYDGKHLNCFSAISTYSFYPAHHITMGEGGAVATDDDLIAAIATSIRDWGRDCNCLPGKDNTCGKRFSQQHGALPFGYDHKYVYSNLGYNLKATDMQAAIGVAQLEKLPRFIEKREQNFKCLYNLLKEFDEFFYLPAAEKKSQPCWFGFPLTIKPESGIERNELTQFFEQNKIATRLFFAGNISKQPYFVDNKFEYRLGNGLKNSDLIMQNSFWLGIYPALSELHFDFMHAVIEKFLRKKKLGQSS